MSLPFFYVKWETPTFIFVQYHKSIGPMILFHNCSFIQFQLSYLNYHYIWRLTSYIYLYDQAIYTVDVQKIINFATDYRLWWLKRRSSRTICSSLKWSNRRNCYTCKSESEFENANWTYPVEGNAKKTTFHGLKKEEAKLFVGR